MENNVQYTVSAEEIAAREAEIAESNALILKEESAGIIQHCTCGALMQKIDGCNWVKCHCSIEWCWVCRKKKGRVESFPEGVNTESICPYGSPGCNSH